MQGKILLEHGFPLVAIIFITAIAVAVAIFSCRHYLARNKVTMLLLILRLLFIILFAWCLLMPVLKYLLTDIVKARLLVALDTSKSMTLTPTNTIPSRWIAAAQVLNQAWPQTVVSDCNVDCYSLAKALSTKTPLNDMVASEPNGTRTCLSANLKKLCERYTGQNVCGLLLLSDGLDTSEPNNAWASSKWPYPIYTVRLEPPNIWKVETDARVDTVNTAHRVIVGWDTELKATVSGQATGGKPFEVQILKNNKLLESAPVEIDEEGGSHGLTFRLSHPETGSFTYTINIPPLDGEVRTNNNTYSVAIEVVDTKNRLLYLEGPPRWESKYLVRALKANQTMTSIAFMRGPGGRFLSYGTRSRKCPELTKAQLLKFKIVILGDLDADELGQPRAKALVQFVEKGGSLILLGGVKAWENNGYGNTVLVKLLPFKKQASAPFQEGQFNVKLTKDGKTHPAFHAEETGFWKKIPPVLSIFSAGSVAPGASVLVSTDEKSGNQPLLLVQPYGQGKVLTVLTDSLWRWQITGGTRNFYQRFWNQMLVWLSPAESEVQESQLDLFADKKQLFLGDSITLSARPGGDIEQISTKDMSVTCEIQAPGKRKIPFIMSRKDVTTSAGKQYPGFALNFSPQHEGLYTATAIAKVDDETIKSDPYSFYLKPFMPETNPRPVDIEALKMLASSSGGKFCELEEINDVLSHIVVKTSQQERVKYRSLWNNIFIISCLVGFLSIEWIIRKEKNMA